MLAKVICGTVRIGICNIEFDDDGGCHGRESTEWSHDANRFRKVNSVILVKVRLLLWCKKFSGFGTILLDSFIHFGAVEMDSHDCRNHP